MKTSLQRDRATMRDRTLRISCQVFFLPICDNTCAPTRWPCFDRQKQPPEKLHPPFYRDQVQSLIKLDPRDHDLNGLT